MRVFESKEHINVMEASQLLNKMQVEAEYLKLTTALKELGVTDKNKLSKQDFLSLHQFLTDKDFLPGFPFLFIYSLKPFFALIIYYHQL